MSDVQKEIEFFKSKFIFIKYQNLMTVFFSKSLLWRERFTFIPEWGFIFARVKTGQVGTLSPIEKVLVQSFSLRHIRPGILREGLI